MARVRRAVLAIFLCAAPLIAAPAQASTRDARARGAARGAPPARSRARARASSLLPLPERPRASAAAALAGELARLARSDGPERLLVGRARPRGRGRRRREAARARRHAGALRDHRRAGRDASPPAPRAVAALRGRPARGLRRARPRRSGSRPTQFDTVDPFTGIKFTWAYDTVRAGEAHRRGRRRLRPDGVRDRHRARRDPSRVRRPGRAHLRHRIGHLRRHRLRRPRHLRDRPDRRARRQRARRQGRGRQHQGGRRARVARTAASRSPT